MGDTGPGAPENWIESFGRGGDQVLVTLHAISPEAMTTYSERLRVLFAEGDAFREIWHADGMALTFGVPPTPAAPSWNACEGYLRPSPIRSL